MADPHPLQGCRERVNRAKSQIDTLNAEIGRSVEEHSHGFRREFESETKRHIFWLETKWPIDIGWGISLGEILHNLRAALDGLVWIVAERYTKDILAAYAGKTPRMQFPIFLNRSLPKGNSCFDGDGKSIHLKFVAPKHISLFDAQQPYAGSNGGKSDPLWILKEMNDIDKHRLIHFTRLASSDYRIGFHSSPGKDLQVGMDLSFGFGPGDVVEDNQVICRIGNVETDDPNFGLEFNLSFEVVFGKSAGPGYKMNAQKTLVLMHERVNGIVGAFDHLFS